MAGAAGGSWGSGVSEGSAVTETRADSASGEGPGAINESGREFLKTARVASGVLVMKMSSAP